ncbi:ABC transporter permease [Halorubrum gandharaense]
MKDRLRRILRIARWETSQAAGGLDRQTLLAALVILLFAGGTVAVGLAAGVAGLDVDRDVYRVGVDDDSPYADAVEESAPLTPVPAERATLGENADAIVDDGGGGAGGAGAAGGVVVWAADSAKGEAAAAAVRDAVLAENERRMAAESNATAAYPLDVTLRYVSRSAGGDVTLGEPPDSGDDDGDGEAGDDAGDGDSDAGDPDSDGTDEDSEDDALGVPSIGGGAFGADHVGSAGGITPPFPFVSLVLAFVFLVPLNFLIQAYGSSILNERVNRRGELLLVTPLAPGDVVAGKTLPYVVAAVGLTTAIALAVGGGPLSVLAVLPLALAFLGATFVGAMFARSFKELTFVTVTVSVVLTTYAFVPAVFTNVTPIALVSPLTIVVFDLQGESMSLVEGLFSTVPPLVVAGLLFTLGAGVYREEDMFTQKPLPRKFLDALAVRLSALPADGGSLRARLRPFAAVAVITACTIPFVFVAELLAVAVLFALPITLSIPVLLVSIAFIEEVAKSLHLYAGFERGVFARTDVVAVGVGLASGFGFFLAEKVTAVVQAVGLLELYVGRAAFGSVAGVEGLSPAVALGLFLAPLALHCFVTVVAAVGASRNRTVYAATLVLATLIHAAYNFVVVSIHG